MAVDIGRIAELPHHHHGALPEIIGQHGRCVATVEDLAGLRLPLAIRTPPFEGRALERVMLMGQHADIFDADAVGDCHVGLAQFRLRRRLAAIEPFGKHHAFLLEIAD